MNHLGNIFTNWHIHQLSLFNFYVMHLMIVHTCFLVFVLIVSIPLCFMRSQRKVTDIGNELKLIPPWFNCVYCTSNCLLKILIEECSGYNVDSVLYTSSNVSIEQLMNV